MASMHETEPIVPGAKRNPSDSFLIEHGATLEPQQLGDYETEEAIKALNLEGRMLTEVELDE